MERGKEEFIERFEQKDKIGNSTFVKLDKRLLNAYQYLPKFDNDALSLYLYLIDKYNEDYGYAFPDTWQIRVDLNMKDHRRKKAIKALKQYGLVTVKKNRSTGNNQYIPHKPLELKEFVEKFPEAVEEFSKVLKDAEDKERKDKQRLKEYQDKKRQESKQE
jgi:hypothetical protein